MVDSSSVAADVGRGILGMGRSRSSRQGIGRGHRSESWACYHTELWETEVDDTPVGVIGNAVGAPFAVLVAEELFASGCGLLVSVTSAGQLDPAMTLP